MAQTGTRAQDGAAMAHSLPKLCRWVLLVQNCASHSPPHDVLTCKFGGTAGTPAQEDATMAQFVPAVGFARPELCHQQPSTRYRYHPHTSRILQTNPGKLKVIPHVARKHASLQESMQLRLVIGTLAQAKPCNLQLACNLIVKRSLLLCVRRLLVLDIAYFCKF